MLNNISIGLFIDGGYFANGMSGCRKARICTPNKKDDEVLRQIPLGLF